MSEETKSGFDAGREYREKSVIISMDELIGKNSRYAWDYVMAQQAGGRDAFLAKVRSIIEKEGGLSQWRMDELGIQSAPREQTETE